MERSSRIRTDSLRAFRKSDPAYLEAVAVEKAANLEMETAIAHLPVPHMSGSVADCPAECRLHIARTDWLDAKDAADDLLMTFYDTL